MRTLVVFGAVAALAAATPAVAAGAGSALRDACRTDYQTLCPEVQPGGGRILACFKAHQDQLSAACVQALKQAQAERAAGDGR